MQLRQLKSLLAATIISCGAGMITAAHAADDAIKLWIAPNEVQEAFWKVAVDGWNESGNGMQVEFTTIPASGSSEEAILTAVASGNAPDISTNIFSGFAAQLAELDQLVDLSSLDGFDGLVAHRKMATIMQGWENGGKSFVFPIYSNPILVWWRADLLETAGWSELPKTFDDVYKLSEQVSEPGKTFGMKVIAGNNWWDRWFDYISFYYAVSNGAPYIADGKAVYDNEAGKTVLGFFKTMFDNEWTSYDFGSDDPFVTGAVYGAVKGPWDIPYFTNQFPEVLKNVKIGPMLGETASDGLMPTFADTKGLVMFSHSKVQPEAWEFIKWVFSNEDLTLLWLEKTGLPPARGDLTEHAALSAYYAENPLAAEYAKYVGVAVPPAMITQTIDVQKSMGTEMIEPIAFKTKDLDAAIADSVARTNALIGTN